MRYSKTHKAETRLKLMRACRALVKKVGFEATGVDAVMSSIGMTAGAFYSHFPSKDALLEAIMEEEVASSLVSTEFSPDNAAGQILKLLKRYLSNKHAEDPETGCVLAALGSEIGRYPTEVRSIVEKGLKDMHANWARPLQDSDVAWSIIAQCVGAVTLARSVKTEKTRNEILDANKRQLAHLIKALVGQ